MLFIHKISNISYHYIGEDQLYAQHKIRTGEYLMVEHCVISYISYNIKWIIPWMVFHFMISVLLISCLSNVSNQTYQDTLEKNVQQNT